MSGATDLWEADILDLIFTNVAAPNMGDVGGLLPSAAPGDMTIALHTGNTISETSTVQSEAVAAYTGYTNQTRKIDNNRSTSKWTGRTFAKFQIGSVQNNTCKLFPRR